MDFLNALGHAVRTIDVPFSYTLTTWSAGAISVDYFGVPRLAYVFAFVIAAMGAYLLCAALSFGQTAGPPQIRRSAISLINVFSVVATAVVSAACRLATTPVIGYVIDGFTGTLTYIVAISALLYWAERRRGNRTR